jgi:hypothetical protein
MKPSILITSVLSSVFSFACNGTTINVRDTASFRDALAQASTNSQITELVLATAEYEGHFWLGKPKDADPATLPVLTIRAGDGQKPLLRYATRIEKAEPIPGKPGLFKVTPIPPREAPTKAQMWERDTRIRYHTLSNKDSAAAYPGSCFADDNANTLWFSTSDGKPPGEHEVWISQTHSQSRALRVERPNVVLDGLRFADYIAYGCDTIQSAASGLTIRNCEFDNCEKAWSPMPNTARIAMENCTGRDVAQPVISYGDGVVVRNCRFEKSRDRFLYPLYPQNDCAYQVYFPGKGGTFEGNFCKGYVDGFVIKADSGLPYVIRHNTIVDTHSGVMWSSTKENSDTSYNIIVAARAFVHARNFASGFRVDHNLFWEPKELGEFYNSTQTLRGGNLGKFNLLADPRFVDAAKGDYRLLPDSPAAWLKDAEGRPAGAFGVATRDDAKNTAPTLTLAFQADSQPLGATGDYTFERDPWIGGGTTHVRELREEGVPRRLTGRDSIVIEPRAFDATGAITKMKWTRDNGQPQELPYDDAHSFALPKAEGEYRIRCQVGNDRGVWSEPADAIVRVDRSAPKLDGPPKVLANNQGIIVTFTTTEPCFATLHHGQSAKALTGRVESKPLIKRSWDSNDGGEWVETWRVPRREHALAVLTPGETLFCKLTLTDQGGLSSDGEVFKAQAKGKPRTILVAPDGQDNLAAAKYRSLQFAVDRALPGDRIVLEPGVYTDYTCLTHGGTDENHRITIEAKPGTVTLDGAKRNPAVIHLENAPWVTLRGLRILYFQKAGVYAYRSPHTHVDQSVFYNGPGWVTGYHTFLFWSPHGTITRSLAVGAEIGFYFLQSPAVTVRHNTASQHMYAAAAYTFSARDTVQEFNSFAFAGNDIYYLDTSHPDEFKTFRSDYNNLGTITSTYNPTLRTEKPGLFSELQAQEFPTKYKRHFHTLSKAVIALDGKRYESFKAWREETGQDKHSIFADPKYVHPWAPIDSWNWGVEADSPNLSVKDDKGMPIGAIGAGK